MVRSNECRGAASTAPGVAESCVRGADVSEATAPDLPYAVDPETGCWVWQRYRDRNGYGRKHSKGTMCWAHRVYYEQFVGPIPEGLDLDHLCSNPPCVNPEHLEPVTRAENTRRAFERRGYGERDIRAARLRSEGLKYAEIAEVLGLAGRESAHGVVKRAIAKGLISPDDVPPRRLLSTDEREEIRDLYALGVNQKELAEWYGIDSSHVSRIVNRKTPRGSE